MGVIPARLRGKRETASKVVLPMEHVQRWTLKGVFPFFHCASAGVPKSLAFFSFFLEAAVVFVGTCTVSESRKFLTS
ncbi:hypothetical protein ABH14_29775 [Brevibacillus brevis]|nr:hypothetical protein [Brevibacillus brevis]